MFLRNATRSLAALVAAGAGLVLGVATALASEPMSEATGRSGIWPPVRHLVRPVLGSDGLADWLVGAAVLLVATATFVFHRKGGVPPE